MLFYANGQIEGVVIQIIPAWNNGPELIRCQSAMKNIGSIRWLEHALADGMILVCPD